MKRAILFVLVLLCAVASANAGVVRKSARVVKHAPKVSAHAVAKSAKLAWRVLY